MGLGRLKVDGDACCIATALVSIGIINTPLIISTETL